MGPIFEKLEFSFFPAVVTDFFYAALQKIKSSREAVKQKVWLFVHVHYYATFNVFVGKSVCEPLGLSVHLKG